MTGPAFPVAPAGALPTLAERAGRVAPFIVMDVVNQATAIERQGGSVVHMEVGQPSAPTPLSIRAAVSRALEHGRIGYTQSLGMDSLRARIARHYAEAYGVDVAAERVVVTTGSSGGFLWPSWPASSPAPASPSRRRDTRPIATS